MKNIVRAIVLMIILSLVGCATSRIVLLESGKEANAIIIKTEQGELVLDEPNTFTVLSSAKAKPAKIQKIDPQVLQKTYGELINSAPKPPISFLLYFELGATSITTGSKKLFPEINKAVTERIPCDINIIGHTDRTGSKSQNIKLSLERARLVYNWLVDQKLDISNTTVESYGEGDPLILTDDGVPEPRNRRVEILIR